MTSEADAKWDGLKGYLTNTDIPVEGSGAPHIIIYGMWRKPSA